MKKTGVTPIIKRKYPTISACGLDCGLCPAFYTQSVSCCPGCCGPNFLLKHPSCGIITCCIKKHGLEICCDCPEFPCSRYTSSGQTDSFITYRNVMKNFTFIKKHGIQAYVRKQRKRMVILTILLNNYNDGRSKSFYCLACTLLPDQVLKDSLNLADEKIKEAGITEQKQKAKLLKDIFRQAALKENVELRLRHKKK